MAFSSMLLLRAKPHTVLPMPVSVAELETVRSRRRRVDIWLARDSMLQHC